MQANTIRRMVLVGFTVLALTGGTMLGGSPAHAAPRGGCEENKVRNGSVQLDSGCAPVKQPAPRSVAAPFVPGGACASAGSAQVCSGQGSTKPSHRTQSHAGQ